MEKKIILIFVVLLFAMGIASGENNTTDPVEIEDNTDYILPISITNEGIKFSDGFTGFCIDPAKKNIETTDKFKLGVLGNDEIENNIKLAIIECYKQGKEDAMEDIIAQIDDKESNNDVLTAVFSSSEKIGKTSVVDINDSTEATFEFEFLKSNDDAKSDCVAYKVSMKTIEKENTSNDTTEDENTSNNQSNENSLAATNDDGNETPSDTLKTNKTNDTEKTTGNTVKNDKKTSEKTSKDNKTDDKKTSEKTNNEKTTTETNKTVVNKTNTVIVNENNTTIINKNNMKTINYTNNTPENDTLTNMLNTAGNPIFLLIIVIIVIVLAIVVMRRKD